MVDRKKELIITAGGENVSPAAVENVLVAHPLIGQALAFGDRRPYLVALLTLDGERRSGLGQGARHRGCLAGRAGRANPVVLAEVERRSRGGQLAAGPGPAGQVLAAAAGGVDAESEELTPTFKLKRRVVHAKYADVIDGLYSGTAS